jgi:glyoxylase-like metal-dependent hydrolase (beta-lactamase superfamily II)
MVPQFKVISIGTLAANHLWDESGTVRMPHATSTLIEVSGKCILIDPSLPPQIMTARLAERTGKTPQEITHVFLTAFLPDRYRGIEAFGEATWLVAPNERVAAESRLEKLADDLLHADDEELNDLVATQQTLLARCEDAPDRLAPGVDLFPLPGPTPGHCGLIISVPGHTVVVAGDSVAAQEHLHLAQVLPECADHDLAQESFREVIEIADTIICGRDNMLPNPVRGMGPRAGNTGALEA